MGRLEKLNLGIVGTHSRGRSFKQACDSISDVRIHAICDEDQKELDEAAKFLGASEKYVDLDLMLEKSDIDALIIATPMQHHVSQAIAALEKGIHVLSEVTAGVSRMQAVGTIISSEFRNLYAG